MANGTDALILALRAYGVGPGDEVVTVANTFIATGEAILLNGARPVFVDVDPETFTMDAGPARARHHPPHQGDPARAPVRPSRRHGRDPRRSPTRTASPCSRTRPRRTARASAGAARARLGHAACFSFYPGKNLGAYGDAGMVTSNDAAFIARVRQMANHGGGDEQVRQRRARHQQPPRHAAGGRAAREAAPPRRVERRAARACRAPTTRRWREPGRRHAARARGRALGLAPVHDPRLERRDALQAHLASRGIATAVHYPRPIHLQPAMASAGGRPGDLPVSERLSREVLSLPLYPELPLRPFGGSPTRCARRRRALPTGGARRQEGPLRG